MKKNETLEKENKDLSLEKSHINNKLQSKVKDLKRTRARENYVNKKVLKLESKLDDDKALICEAKSI